MSAGPSGSGLNKETRNSIAAATQRARALLEDDFSAQLEGDFDVHRNGTVGARAGRHLSARQVFQRERIVSAIEHKRSTGLSSQDAVRDYLRDAAFTTLNRFVALKMLEARELVQECITKGEQSGGYREFCGMAPGLPLLSESAGYRLYLESLFDELSTEVKVLFDRRDPSSVLWPKRATFEMLLEILNAPELARVWGEDETIGWVYQFFNGQDERRKMREESQAPRNSRELAVRNQFFTPRYVVQFLTDNTLGRVWCEMRGGETVLAEKCGYLVRKPGAEFAPRVKKDPRDVRVLDPACGSGHFLLYAFDLLLAIYEEAYADPASPQSEATGKTLAEDYSSVHDLMKAVPGLVLAHNLHGVDIDPRCAQIAQLALWMRAQKAFRDFGIGRGERARIRRSNIVVAEPLVVDDKTTKDFIAHLDDIESARLFKALIAELRLAGELGLLSRIETLVPGPVRKGQSGDLFAPAPDRIRQALSRFVTESGSRASTSTRLFSDDVAHAVALLETAEKKFDVILMNPPFGEVALSTRDYVASRYPAGSQDICAAFVQCHLGRLAPDGFLGAITTRLALFIPTFAEWRREILRDRHLTVLADLGYGVLDAMVETAAYVLRESPSESPCGTIGLLEEKDKGASLQRITGDHSAGGISWIRPTVFEGLPGMPVAYWIPATLITRFKNNETFLGRGGVVRPGLQTSDDFRFLRLRWEVPTQTFESGARNGDEVSPPKQWVPFCKGGEYGLWWDDVHLTVQWARNGLEIKNYVDENEKLRSRPQNTDYYFRGGSTYPYRTTSAFGLRYMPAGCAFSHGGWGVFPPKNFDDWDVLATYNTRFVRYFMEVLLGQGDSSVSGTAARNQGAEAVGGVPWPTSRPRVGAQVRRLVDTVATSVVDESALFFDGASTFRAGSNFEEILGKWWQRACDSWTQIADDYSVVERAVRDAYQFSSEELDSITEAEGRSLAEYPCRDLDAGELAKLFRSSVEQLTERAKSSCGAKRYTVKKAYFVERTIDLASHIFKAHPHSVIAAARAAGPTACGASRSYAESLLSWVLGCAIGRFEPRNENSLKTGPSSRAVLPASAVGERGGAVVEMWVDDEGHKRDIVALVEDAAHQLFGAEGTSVLDAAVHASGWDGTVREWFGSELFAVHLATYSKSRRSAPLYWQLTTGSGMYSVWLYYPALTSDSLFGALNGFVGPKVQHEERRLARLVDEIGSAGSPSQRRALSNQETAVAELRAFLDEVKRIAPVWNPNLGDGVIINFAPLWRLVPQNKAWQKELKSTWDALTEGKYDWAHLAMHLWPERVVPKCAKDRSLAIAHGLEKVFWVEGTDGRWSARRTPTRSVDELVKERTSPAVKSALKSLLEAPVASGKGAVRKGGARRKAAASNEGDA